MTARDTILMAVHDLTRHGQADCHKGAIVLRSWELNPLTFCLRGCGAKHPDSNRVYMELPKMVRLWNLLERTAPNFYGLTSSGKHAVRKILERRAAVAV